MSTVLPGIGKVLAGYMLVDKCTAVFGTVACSSHVTVEYCGERMENFFSAYGAAPPISSVFALTLILGSVEAERHKLKKNKAGGLGGTGPVRFGSSRVPPVPVLSAAACWHSIGGFGVPWHGKEKGLVCLPLPVTGAGCWDLAGWWPIVLL